VIKGIVSYYDGTTLAIVIGTGEDVKAPRQLAALEKQGWPVDDQFAATFKAWLAGKRQGDIPADSRFEDWVDTVSEVDLRPSVKQIEQAVALGSMERDSADRLIALLGDDGGEAGAPPA
jgi:hypothetical protein